MSLTLQVITAEHGVLGKIISIKKNSWLKFSSIWDGYTNFFIKEIVWKQLVSLWVKNKNILKIPWASISEIKQTSFTEDVLPYANQMKYDPFLSTGFHNPEIWLQGQ